MYYPDLFTLQPNVSYNLIFFKVEIYPHMATQYQHHHLTDLPKLHMALQIPVYKIDIIASYMIQIISNFYIR